MPSVFSEDLKSSDKSRLKVAPRPKFSLSAAVAAALILEGGVAARSEKKTRFLGKTFDLATPAFQKLVGILMNVHARTGPVAVADLEKMLHNVSWLLGDVDL